MWTKKGNIFSDHHAQLPVSDVLEDRIRIYYSTRREGKSVPMFIEVDKLDPSIILDKSEDPLLELGEPGSFDHSGVMPTCLVNFEGKKYMYYIGWSQRRDVPYHNTLGLAISEDGVNWKKAFDGPVFGTSRKEPGYIGTAEILIEDGTWKMWYLSCRSWIENECRMEPIYDIKYAESKNGIDWDPLDKVCVPLLDNEGGISAARIIKGEEYEIYFSVRGKINYRNDKSCSYRIKKSTSKDGTEWVRCPEVEIDISEEGWDDFMVCYPSLVKTDTNLFMFYNGNGFGKTGIGYATKETT